MDRFEAEEYLDCRRCRDAMKSKSKIKKIKSITRSTRFDSRSERPAGDEFVATKEYMAEVAKGQSWARHAAQYEEKKKK